MIKLLKKNKNNDKNNSSDNEFNNGGHDDHDLWYEDSLNNEDSPLDDIVEKFASMGEKEVLEDKDKEKVKKILEEIKKTLQKLKKIKAGFSFNTILIILILITISLEIILLYENKKSLK